MESLWEQFRAVDTDGEAAWPALAALLFPLLLPIASRQPIGRLRSNSDTQRDIVTRVLERLHARSFAAIHKLCAAQPAPPLEAWLRILVRNAAIDVMRANPEFERANEKRDARWISLATLVSTPGAPPDSLVEKRRVVLGYLRTCVDRAAALARDTEDVHAALATEWSIARTHVRRLVQRGPQYLAVLEAVLGGHSYPEVAESLGMSRREVELTVQYIEELLAARRFSAAA